MAWKKSNRKCLLDENNNPLLECKRCEEMLPPHKFYANPKGILGRASLCIECTKNRGREWRDDRKDYSRDYHLKQRFDISLENYYEMRKAQDGKCSLCENSSDELAVDHDHSTGKVRALLCYKCNRGLGQFNDSIQLLEKAVLYLKRFENK